ncbi:DUF2207 domain-containing protein [Candidatus Uhrbacteria bacterium]|nr:DUF2207 domain-containing protein [Candidatus Uhrbacteria bacterium]
MKRFLLSLALILVGISFASATFAAEIIRRFDVSAELASDRMLRIQETIEYDFGGAQRHGIFRLIPVVYSRNGASYRLHLNVEASTVDGQPVRQDVSTEGENLRIRLGDPDLYVTGKKTYVITYSTDRAINDFEEDGERELYWNVTGDWWEIPIESSMFTLTGPAEATKAICFTGVYGSTEQDCSITSSSSMLVSRVTRPLAAREGFTIAVRYPASSIAAIPAWKTILNIILDNIWLATPFIVFIAMYAYWRRYGKEPDGRGTVIAHYEEPRGLPPALLAAILEQEISQKAVTATILDLARREYLKVIIEGDPEAKGWFAKKATYRFHKLEKASDLNELKKLSGFELTLLTGLFDGEDEVSLEDKKDGSFWKSVQTARHEAFDQLKSKGLFTKNPAAVRGMWSGIAVVVGIAGFFLSGFFGGLMIFAAIVSAVIIGIFGWHMPQKTKEGAIVAEEAEGFKLFLSVTERDRLNFTDAPERRPDQFARFLPAAVAFGVEEKWAKQFANLAIQPPSYIQGGSNAWTAFNYAHMVDSMHAASASSLYHNPSSAGSGGSGFSGGGSGGGGGGGGGGSW